MISVYVGIGGVFVNIQLNDQIHFPLSLNHAFSAGITFRILFPFMEAFFTLDGLHSRPQRFYLINKRLYKNLKKKPPHSIESTAKAIMVREKYLNYHYFTLWDGLLTVYFVSLELVYSACTLQFRSVCCT
jgi:hypothetical protein